MSQDATFGQATHTLTLIDQQKPSTQDLKVLHDGYLADLLRAIKLGKVPARPDFQKFLGLVPELNVWRTLTLGQHGSPNAYRDALEFSGFRIGDYAGQILEKISVSQTPVEVDLVRVTVADLGFKDGARCDAIYARAIELGLELCPAEVGPALRLVYKEDTYTVVGMEPMIDSGDYWRVFNVYTDLGERVLGGDRGRPGGFWVGSDQWVFVRPRKS
jgi:hypothetical protein